MTAACGPVRWAMADPSPTELASRTAPLLAQAREALARGDVARAHALGTSVLGMAPANADARVLMGEICLASGRFAEAIEHRQQAVELLPPSPLRRVQLAEAYVHAGRLGDALAEFAATLELDAGFAPAISGRAEVYEMQGNTKRAWKTLEPALARDPRSPPLAAVGVRVLMDMGRHREAIALGERVLQADPPHDPHLRNMTLSLARAYERAGQHERALETARLGNAMLAVPYDPAEARERFDATMDAFDAGWMADAPRAGRDGSWAVFIVGMPRSGSTLTERIIHAHPEAFGADEDFTLQSLAASMQGDYATRAPFPQAVRELNADALTDLGARYERTMRAKSPHARTISNKDLGNMRRLGLADLALPGARFIHTVRDPADNCLSCYFERLKPQAIRYAGSFEHLAAAYAENLRLWEHWKAVCKNPTLTIRYEDIVEDPATAARTIIDFVGLPWDDACLRPHEANRADRTLSATQVRRPIYKAARGRAARYGELLAPLHGALARHGLG